MRNQWPGFQETRYDMEISKTMREMVEVELRKGTSRTRIAHLLDVSYDQVLVLIERIKQDIWLQVGQHIRFTFRGQQLVGTITRLLTNSAIVTINWQQCGDLMKGVCEDKVAVNFKDIDAFISSPEQ